MREEEKGEKGDEKGAIDVITHLAKDDHAGAPERHGDQLRRRQLRRVEQQVAVAVEAELSCARPRVDRHGVVVPLPIGQERAVGARAVYLQVPNVDLDDRVLLDEEEGQLLDVHEGRGFRRVPYSVREGYRHDMVIRFAHPELGRERVRAIEAQERERCNVGTLGCEVQSMPGSSGYGCGRGEEGQGSEKDERQCE